MFLEMKPILMAGIGIEKNTKKSRNNAFESGNKFTFTKLKSRISDLAVINIWDMNKFIVLCKYNQEIMIHKTVSQSIGTSP